MQYIINSHFRVELNVSQDQPIPKLSEFLTEDEISANQALIQNEIELQDAMGRDDVQFSGKDYSDISSPMRYGGLMSPTKTGDESVKEQEQLGNTRNKLNKWFPV